MTGADLARLFCVVFVGVTSIVIGDTAGKLLTAEGVDPFIIAWSRFGIACIVMLPLSGLKLQELPNLGNPHVLIRGSLISASICLILTALKTEPIANVFGAFFIGPIVSYGIAALFLGEKITKARSVLLALGFLGVMLVVKPGLGGGTGMLFALAAGSLHGVYLAMTRMLAAHHRPRFLLISHLLIGTVILTPFGLASDFPTLSLGIIALLLLSAAGSAAGNFLLVTANKRAEASLIAPLIYSQLISAAVLGILVFDDWPDLVALLGLVLIGLSGAGSLMVSRAAETA